MTEKSKSFQLEQILQRSLNIQKLVKASFFNVDDKQYVFSLEDNTIVAIGTTPIETSIKLIKWFADGQLPEK